jgi:hypothetical protein
MTDEKKRDIYYIAWLNLFVGIWNLYLYVNGGSLFWNFLIGSLNIGVWVFNRNILKDNNAKRK